MTIRLFLKLIAETPNVPDETLLEDFLAIAAYRLAKRRYDQRRARAS